jgi:flagellin
MKINHNIPALRTVNHLNKVNNSTVTSMERLSSGIRINRSADDAAGMAISNKMDAQVKGLQQANRNSLDGISLIQTAEGSLNETHEILQRMRELAVQAANGTNTEDDLEQMQEEINQLTSEINRIGATSEFNAKLLFKEEKNIQLQVGANAHQTLTVTINKMNSVELGISTDDKNKIGQDGFSADTKVANGDNKLEEAALDFTKIENAEKILEQIDGAIEKVSTQRGILGAYQNRLEHTVTNLGTSEENLTSALSRILDTDMAEEMTNYTKGNVLTQAATAMLAQANQRPQQVLQLLQS